VAYFAYGDFAGDSTGIENHLAYKIKCVKDAADLITTAIATQRTRLDAIADTTGIAALLRGAVEPSDSVLAALENAAVAPEMAVLNAAIMDTDLTPRDGSALVIGSTFDAWFTSVKTSLTNPLLTNEFSRVWRRLFGQASLSAKNCSGVTGTSFGTAVISGATTITFTTVADPIDTTLYGGGLLELYVTTQVESADTSPTTGTLTGVDLNGSAWTGTYSIADASIVGSVHLVVPSIAKTYPVEITAMTTANAGSGAVTVRIRAPRTIAA